MIQIYKPGTSLDNNGDIVLTPTECTVTARLNEVWVLEMTHPLDPDERWKYIVEEGILKVPTWQTNEQLYRIAQIEKTDTDVRVIAYPIFTDTRNQCFIEDLTVSGTGQTVLNQMLALGPTGSSGSPLYSGVSNLPTARRAQFQRRNFMDCLNGNDDPSFVKLWGGEIAYDNFKIYVNEEIGADHDVYVRYGKNITGVEYTIDFSDVCTRIYPQAYGGYGLQSGQAWVDSSLVNTYDCLYIRNMVFDNIRLLEDVPDSEDSVNYIVCANRSQMDTYLRQACRDLFADGCDKPKVSLKVNLIDLSVTDQYKDFTDLEKISLGDTVHCVHSKLGITSDARATCIVWDCARNRIESVELGDFTYDYFKEVSSKVNAISKITNPDGTLMAERVRGFLDATKTAIHTIRTTAADAHVMGVLFEDKVKGSNTYGALGIGTKGLMVAKEWDDNTNDWAWETAITADGILSPMIVTNTLSGTSATNWWDLQLGEISFQTISDDINDRISDAVSSIDTEMTSLEICNAIFDDGRIKGFKTRKVGTKTEFYLSFDALIGGQAQLGGQNNGNGLLSILNASGTEIIRFSNAGASFRNSSGNETMQITDAVYFYDNGKYIGEMSGGSGFVQITNPGKSTSRGFKLHNGVFSYYEAIPAISLDDPTMQYDIPFGSDDPDAKIDFVEGSFMNKKYGFVFRTENNTASYLFDYITSSGAVMYLLQMTSSAATFDVPVYGSFNQNSDRRLKENFGDSIEAMPLIDSIPIRSYDWIKDGRHVSAGIVAQDLQKIAPELVSENSSTGMLGIRYMELVPYLVKALQEQNAQMEELRNLINSLTDEQK